MGQNRNGIKLNNRISNSPSAKEARLENFRTMVNECVGRNDHFFIENRNKSIVDYLTELKDTETDAKGLRV